MVKLKYSKGGNGPKISYSYMYICMCISVYTVDIGVSDAYSQPVQDLSLVVDLENYMF